MNTIFSIHHGKMFTKRKKNCWIDKCNVWVPSTMPETENQIYYFRMNFSSRDSYCQRLSIPFFLLVRLFMFFFFIYFSIRFGSVRFVSCNFVWLWMMQCIVVLSLIFHHYSSIFPMRVDLWFSWMIFFFFCSILLLIHSSLSSWVPKPFVKILYSSSCLYCIRLVEKKLHLRPA